MQTDAGPENLYAWLARHLAARLGLPAETGTRPLTLNDVIVRHLANRGRREDLYTRIRTIMREANFAPPPALRKLAEITDFNLYVSTSFDSLLEDALNAARFGGLRTTDVLAYTRASSLTCRSNANSWRGRWSTISWAGSPPRPPM